MREIKFRAWKKDTKEMYDIAYLNCGKIREDKNEIVMQFTGLKDKNGKEIYEGDVVNAEGYGFKPFLVEDIRTDTLKIARMIKFKQDNKNAVAVEVIGNKFENPELLEDDLK